MGEDDGGRGGGGPLPAAGSLREQAQSPRRRRAGTSVARPSWPLSPAAPPARSRNRPGVPGRCRVALRAHEVDEHRVGDHPVSELEAADGFELGGGHQMGPDVRSPLEPSGQGTGGGRCRRHEGAGERRSAFVVAATAGAGAASPRRDAPTRSGDSGPDGWREAGVSGGPLGPRRSMAMGSASGAEGRGGSGILATPAREEGPLSPIGGARARRLRPAESLTTRSPFFSPCALRASPLRRRRRARPRPARAPRRRRQVRRDPRAAMLSPWRPRP